MRSSNLGLRGGFLSEACHNQALLICEHWNKRKLLKNSEQRYSWGGLMPSNPLWYSFKKMDSLETEAANKSYSAWMRLCKTLP